ncbi:MAG: LysE family translocator [Caulobacterales bacterium]|jgi:RhtB (resistance to homoserine/threonine) family protein
MTNPLLSLASLALVSLVTAAVPGPSIFLIMRTAMRRGRGPGMMAALGTLAGCAVWCAAAALGLAALLTAAPWLYTVLRLAGGLYLLWFAVQLWRAPKEALDPAAQPQPGGAFWRAFIVCLTNPKSVLFFGSIFAAYMGPDSPLWVHGAAVAIVCATCLVFNAAVAWFFSTARTADAYARAQKPLDRVAGALMGAFGLSLLWVFD